jgi:hypothetical protein
MKNYIYKTLSLLTAVSVLTSCLKDDSLVLNPDKTHNVIEFANPAIISSPVGAVYPLYSLAYDISPQATLPLTVSYSGAENGAPQDIVVNLAIGTQTEVDAYNEEQHSAYDLMTSDVFTLTTNTVTIKKGQKTATVDVNFLTNKFDFGLSYLLPVKITSASSGVVSGNFSTILLSVNAKNMYDGVYSVTGSVARNSAAGPDTGLGGNYNSGVTTELVTQGPSSVGITPQWRDGSAAGGVAGTSFSVDPATNLVTVTSTGNLTLKNTVGTISNYDPATRTFTLNYDWGVAPGTRVVTAKLTYLRSR